MSIPASHVERVLADGMPQKACAQCKSAFHPKRPSQDFCCDKCRMGYYIDHGMEGAVYRVQRTRAGASVVIHLSGPAAESAMGLPIGSVIRVVSKPCS